MVKLANVVSIEKGRLGPWVEITQSLPTDSRVLASLFWYRATWELLLGCWPGQRKGLMMHFLPLAMEQAGSCLEQQQGNPSIH